MKTKTITTLLIICILLSVFTAPAFALTWDGSSSGGGGGGLAGTSSGYAVRSTDLNVACVGYRFSVMDKSGNIKAGNSVDVFRNTSGGNAAITNNSTFSSKLNKRQLINGQNNGYATSKSTTNCLYESGMSFATALPAPSGIGTWQNNLTNLNKVFSWMGVGSVDNLKNGDKLLIEPLWDVKLKSVYHSLTATEIAIYGKWLLGVNSDGGSSTTSDTWGFISRFTNREFPNALFTPDGQGLWPGVSAITSSTRGTFHTLINNGYGVGIGYTETRLDFSPNQSVNTCEAWRGSLSTRTFHYGTSNGSAFGNFTYANGYPILGDTIWFNVHFPAESQDTTVRQYIRIQGGSWTTRDVTLSGGNTNSQWFPAALSPTTIDAGRSSYIIEAKTDWMSGSTVLKSGSVKTFYIPVRPKVNRYQVTINDITNTQIARNGALGLSGSVYVGQKIYLKYTYTSSCSWSSNNNYAVNLYYTNDFTLMSTAISSSSPIERNSSYSPYVVPNVAPILPVEMVTSWSTDAGRTRETTDVSIPVIRADAELREIRLIDAATGAYVTGTKLTPGQKVTPQYTYKNNTNVRIFVEGYDNDLTRLGGSSTAYYAIPANGEIYVNGKQLTVPNATTYSVWGGVYLDGAGRGNTSWENYGSNNDKTVTFTVENPLKIETITPNAKYREGIEVVTSFIVKNPTNIHYTTANSVSVRFTASNGSTTLYTTTKSGVVIQAYLENLVYFKWTVPAGLNGVNITLKGEVISGGAVMDTKTMTNGSEVRPTSQTPDTVFEKSKPAGFNVTSIPTRAGTATTAQWSEYVYEASNFVVRTYGLQLNPAAPSIVPDVNAPSRDYTGGRWSMGSGYGFTLDWSSTTQTVSGFWTPTAASVTAAQSAYLYFPEFGYANAANKYRLLDKNGTNSFWFPVNPNAKNNARLHFIPLWYPNGNYQCQGFVTDVWTPAGMISGYYNSNTMTIIGNAYDDWYIGH